ncbi:hypothetical protein K493DRAFT_212171 [Basidiobolus meristosporus CBS 931.73]|uniref:Vacuole membrane protein 1 n=1 Tax=Basidiobolus meristosporus CBS 931.73 TaxID=1314790 RepID=A0A1Y1YNY8_9FUNG|nr:hypothetical protein K493DRAFT_212171 [Basidiobolus meristosporus CBS 931.73]|eukprot:ORX99712.1 hypothetical protein K493DRAFT_212171 [Basidiobolus meristosporus CBS 931.73]
MFVYAEYLKTRHLLFEKERSEFSVYTSPLRVFTYFFLYLWDQLRSTILFFLNRGYLIFLITSLAVLGYLIYILDGTHQPTVQYVEAELLWIGYWIMLGVASSIGLGTGLHTFVLFLGPHIASVTLTAYECGSLDFAVRGENSFACNPDAVFANTISIWGIFHKVHLECFFWGLGTALGELPPYFVARAAALSGQQTEEIAVLESLRQKKSDTVTLKEHVMLYVQKIMQRFGFFGIFLFASIPNPLFDLAGITCGHFLVPLSTFIGATFLGKAVVKSAIQSFFVIIMFSKETLAGLLSRLENSFPYIHDLVESAVREQSKAFQRSPEHQAGPAKTSLISLCWNGLITIMLAYFLLSIVESLAVTHLKKIHDERTDAHLEKKRQK